MFAPGKPPPVCYLDNLNRFNIHNQLNIHITNIKYIRLTKK